MEMFKEKGYLPSAVVNFVAWLGWGPEGIEESGYMTLEEMAEKVGEHPLYKLFW